jgi:Undecaprenyl-phosphate galactose phosphotransferase WbaP
MSAQPTPAFEPLKWHVASLSLAQLRLSKFAILMGDALAFVIAFCLTTILMLVREGSGFAGASEWFSGQDPERYIAWAVLAVVGLTQLLTRYQHYSDRRPFWDQVGDFIRLSGSLALLDMTLIAVTRWNSSRLWWVVSWVMVFFALLAMRAVTRWCLSRMGYWSRPTLIVGTGRNALDAADALRSEPGLGFSVQGFVQVGPDVWPQNQEAQPRIPLEQIDHLARKPGIQWVIALEHAQSDQREHWLRSLSQSGAPDISVIPAMRGVPLYGTDMSYFFSHEVALLRMRNNLRRWPARLTKRIFDTVTAATLLLMLSPLMLYVALRIRQDGGPALFAHWRVGRGGRLFPCYKFRSMVVDSEQQLEALLQQRPDLRKEWTRDQKLKNDPRVSAIGHFLRRTSMDELPQLLNVLRGEMSLVGPRPVVKFEMDRYGKDEVYYHMVRPGMTGLWQVNGRSDADYDARVYLDSWYVKNWSLSYDLIILFKTVGVVMQRNGAY